MSEQLRLLSPQPSPRTRGRARRGPRPAWELTARDRRVGRRGVAEARAILERAAADAADTPLLRRAG